MESITPKPFYQVAISFDAEFIYLKRESNTLLKSNPINGEPITCLRLRKAGYLYSKQVGITNVAKSINGLFLIFIYADDTYTEWPLSQVFTGVNTDPAFIYRAISEDGQWALRETKRGCIQTHNLKTGQVTPFGYNILPQITERDTSFWRKVLISNDAQFIVRAKFGNDTWDQASGLVLTDLKHDKTKPIILGYRIQSNDITTLTLSGDSKLLQIGFRDGSLGLYRIQDGQQIMHVNLFNYSTTSIAQKVISGNISIISGASNGSLSVYTKEIGKFIRFKLDHLISMALFTPDNRHVIVGENTIKSERWHLFEIKVPSNHNIGAASNMQNHSNLFWPSNEVKTTFATQMYHCLLYNIGSKDEILHCVQKNAKNVVLLFKSYANASFFTQMLRDQGLATPTPHQITEYNIRKLCYKLGYSCEVVPEDNNTLIEKELFFEVSPSGTFSKIGIIYGPGRVLQRYYVNQQLYFEKEIHIKYSHMCFVFAPAPLWSETFSSEAEGHILFFPDDRHTYFKIKVILSLITKTRSAFDSYLQYDITHKDIPTTENSIFSRKTIALFEIQLLRFLNFQEDLLGIHHEQLVETLAKLFETYQLQGRDAEAQTILLRKKALEKLYEEHDIILSSFEPKTINYTLFDICKTPLNFFIYLTKANIFVGYLFLETRTYTTSEDPYSSRIVLKVSPDKIADSQSNSYPISTKHTDSMVDPSIFHQINNLFFTNIVQGTSFLFEPDGWHLTSIKKVWYNCKMLFRVLSLMADCKFLLSELKNVRFASQIKKAFANLRKILNKLLVYSFIIFCTSSFLCVSILVGFGKDQIQHIVVNSIPLFLQTSFLFTVSLLVFVITSSLLTAITLVFANAFGVSPLVYIADYLEQKYKLQPKLFIWLPLIGCGIILFPSIVSLIFGIWLGGIKLAEPAGLWASKLEGKSYWLMLIIISFMASVGDLVQLVLTAKYKNLRFFFLNICNYFFNKLYPKTFSGALVLSFFGLYLNQWLRKFFDAGSYVSTPHLAAIGAYIGLSRERVFWRTPGGLIGAALSICLLEQHSATSLLNKMFLVNIGKTIGAYVGGITGLLGGAIIAILICISTFLLLLELYFLADKVSDDIARKGFQKMFGAIVFMFTVLVGILVGGLFGYLYDLLLQK